MTQKMKAKPTVPCTSICHVHTGTVLQAQLGGVCTHSLYNSLAESTSALSNWRRKVSKADPDASNDMRTNITCRNRKKKNESQRLFSSGEASTMLTWSRNRMTFHVRRIHFSVSCLSVSISLSVSCLSVFFSVVHSA